MFDAISRRGQVTEIVGDAAYLQAMLDTEAALARAVARAGLIPADHADLIAAACNVERFDIPELGAAAAAAGNPVVPLVQGLRNAVGDEAGGSVHLGATSQDILDTATMLVAREALTAIVTDIDAAGDAAARLADHHRETVMAGRTLLQQALHPHGPQVVAFLAEDLGLQAPDVPWHANRARIGILAGGLGVAAGTLAKPARDVTLLAQTEVGEVREGVPGRGSSSAMAHKHNPVAAIATLANTMEAPGLVATILGTAAAGHEHERAAGGWQAEWHPLRGLFVAVGSAAAWLADCLIHLEVDTERMRSNIGAELEKLLDPPDHVGSTDTLIGAALRRHNDRSPHDR